MAEVWEHAQLKERNRWTEVNTPAGKVPALLPPGQEEGARMDPVPALGEHTESLLLELGLEDAEIEQLRKDNAI
jgi:crotonobetainyl-CoA:carnitine CoA-transferase CaiB-like acyl-CoA transferase